MKTIKLVTINGIYNIASYGEEYSVTEEEYNKITSNKFITKKENGQFIFSENDDYLNIEKNNLINKYKQTLSEIKEIIFEINEIEETKEFLPEKNQTIASNRLEVLKQKRTTLRDKLGEIINNGIEKYGEGIINELY